MSPPSSAIEPSAAVPTRKSVTAGGRRRIIIATNRDAQGVESVWQRKDRNLTTVEVDS